MKRRFTLDAFEPASSSIELPLEVAGEPATPAAAIGIATEVATGRLMSPLVGAQPAPDLASPARDSQPIENLFVPEHYESKYAYPLIVWLQTEGAAEPDFRKLMPQISTRNYFGLSLRCEVSTANDDAITTIEERLIDTVKQIRRAHHIHSERIFLAGFGDGATLALHLSLRRPEWFAGVAALAGQFPKMPLALNRFRDLIGKRVFLGTGTRNASCRETDLLRTGRLLHVAGIRVCTRFYDAGPELSADMLAELNRWVMAEMYEKSAVA